MVVRRAARHLGNVRRVTGMAGRAAMAAMVKAGGAASAHVGAVAVRALLVRVGR